jgi:hypothetical protein
MSFITRIVLAHGLARIETDDPTLRAKLLRLGYRLVQTASERVVSCTVPLEAVSFRRLDRSGHVVRRRPSGIAKRRQAERLARERAQQLQREM